MSSGHLGRGLTRRDLLKKAGLLGVAVATPAEASAAEAGPAQPSQQAAPAGPFREPFEALTSAEADILEAVVARLIPSDANGPGAAEARAAHYIDRALTGPLLGSRDNYRVGLAALDDYAVATKGAPFIQLGDADKDSLLSDVEGNRAPGFLPSAAAFFAMVRGHTIQGTFCDPYYGGNAGFVGWDLIGYPGVRTAVSPEEQRRVTTDLPPVRGSAYDFAAFSKRRLGEVSRERDHDD
jgi:gluconate 2-dehydrogenase gamma chain